MFLGFSIFIKEAKHSNTGLYKIINLGFFIIFFKKNKFAGVPQGPLSII